MSSTLPSPPLSPIDKKPILGTRDTSSRKSHQRHPPRQTHTFELLQALVMEHQRLEKQDYETMLRQVPAIRRSTTNAPQGILVKDTIPQSPRHSVVRFAPGPPKIYKYHKVPQEV